MRPKILVWNDRSLVHFILSKHIQENFDCELYSIYDVIEGPKEYFEKQKFVEYKKSWFFHEHILKTKRNQPDLKYLNDIEQKYNINLWLIASNDRFFYKFNGFYKFSYDEILFIIEDEIKLFEKILDESKPDVILMQMSNLQHNHIFYQICRAKKITVLSPHGARIGIDSTKSTNSSMMYLNDEANLCLPLPNQNEIEEESKKKSSVLENYKDDKKFSFELENSKRNYFQAAINFLFSKNNNIKTHYTYFGRNKIKVIFQMISYELKKKYRASFMEKKLEKEIDNSNFIYFPLHQEMERVLLIGAPFYTNQVEIVKNIANSLPLGYKLFVKEHPTRKARGWRSVDDMKKMMELHNVILFHPSVNSNEIIKKSKLVISITGTASIEAATFGKPSISLEKVGLYKISTVNIINSIKELPVAIKNALNQKVDKKEVEMFKKAIENKAFEFRFSDMSNVFNNVLTTGGYNANTKITDQKILGLCKKFNRELSYATEKYVERIRGCITEIEN